MDSIESQGFFFFKLFDFNPVKIKHVGKMFEVNQYGLCKGQMLSKPQGVRYTFLITFISRFFFNNFEVLGDFTSIFISRFLVLEGKGK